MPASVAVPPLPGATNTFCTRGLAASFHASACSRPPLPMTRTFISVTEVPHAGEHHGDAMLVGRLDHLVVAQAAARLDHRLRTRLRERVEAVAEGKEGIRRHSRAGERELRALCLERGDAHAVDAAHLAGADAKRRAALTEDDGVRLDELGHAPGEE